MAGTKAEQMLLGALLLSPKMYPFTTEEVSRADFTDDRLGIIYEGIGQMRSAGNHVDSITVADAFPEWDVRGLSMVELMTWAEPQEVYPGAAETYARTVRTDALNRSAQFVAQYLMDETRDGGSSPADLITKARGLLDAAIDGASSNRIKTKLLGELLEMEDRRDWVIPGMLERQDRLILTAGEGVGKSTFARQIVVMSSAGLHPLLRDVEIKNSREWFSPQLISPVRVLVIDAENSELQWRRAVRKMVEEAKRIGNADPGEEIRIAAGRRINLTKGSDLADIHRLVDEHKPDLLYIGPLYKATDGAITNDDHASPLIKALDSLRERGLALIMEGHAKKGEGNPDTRDLRPRGSAALTGWPEFGIGIGGEQNDEIAPLIHWRGARDTNHMWPKNLRRGRDWWPFEIG
ncbi:AAA family ATPase [Leucobacter viscericola]|uniref:AAA family ATPase n=1 Tax=Leucobacter viscericola TaxID=2714935 RepID=A0A6G7XCX7_9MICO|nr:AAA family ATPase [Leucobacter viscericola]QIK62326.1 AAA family ATPase [Leucobacter viscericola]